MTTVYLYGHLGRKFGHRWNLDVSTPAEAIRAIMANRPDFQAHLTRHSRPGYHILVGKDSIGTPSHLHYPSGQQHIKIIPAIAGAGGGGFMDIIIGVIIVAVVVAAFAFTGPGGGLLAAEGGLTLMGSLAVSAGFMGAGLIVGGISQLLAGTPSSPDIVTSERPENRPSSTFNGVVNTTAQGHPVPVGYGRLRVGSTVVSAGMSLEDIAP